MLHEWMKMAASRNSLLCCWFKKEFSLTDFPCFLILHVWWMLIKIHKEYAMFSALFHGDLVENKGKIRLLKCLNFMGQGAGKGESQQRWSPNLCKVLF